MIEAQNEHKGRIVEILTQTFEDNEIVFDIVGRNMRSFLRLKVLMKLSFRYVFWNLILVIRVVGLKRLSWVMRREMRINKLHPLGRIYYLWFIGALPEMQGKGKGSKLLIDLIAEAKLMDRKFWLETSTLKNLRWYQRFDFNIYHTLDDFNNPLYFFSS